MSTVMQKQAKSLNEIEMLIRGAVGLQLAGRDIAIPYLQGAPGCGKTALINTWGAKNNWQIFSTHFSRIPVEEISGLPLFSDIEINGEKIQGTNWSYPDLLTKIYKFDQNRPVILFLDDFHLCSPAHLELGFELFSNRSLRGYKLPNNVAFILAGNNSSKAGSKAGNSAIINRCSIYPVFMDFNYWKANYAVKYGVNYKIITFLSNEKYRKYFHMEENAVEPWASPRAWSRLSEFLNPLEQATNNNITHADLTYYTAAHVGSTAAAEFAAFYKLYLETEMDKVFDGKKEILIPRDMTGLYIYTLASTAEFINRYTKLSSLSSSAKQTKKMELFKLFGTILGMINQINSSIPIVGVIELTNFGNKSVYMDFSESLKAIDIDFYNSISKEIQIVMPD